MRTNRISDSRARRFKIEADARYLEFLRDSSIVDCRLHVVQPYRSNYPLAFSAKITKCDPDDRAFSSACNASDSHLKTRNAKSAGTCHRALGTGMFVASAAADSIFSDGFDSPDPGCVQPGRFVGGQLHRIGQFVFMPAPGQGIITDSPECTEH